MVWEKLFISLYFFLFSLQEWLLNKKDNLLLVFAQGMHNHDIYIYNLQVLTENYN
jgi:hypothetical protein